MNEKESILLGMIASWANVSRQGSGPDRAAGRGRIIATIPSSNAPYLIVQVFPRAGDDEPPHHVIVRCDEAGLNLFSTFEAEDLWFAWAKR